MNESAFDRWRAIAGYILAPLTFVILWFASFPSLSPQAHALAAIVGLTVVLWVTEAIPMAATALLGPALCVICGVAKDKEIFASFGHPVCMLFIGSFLLAQAMQKHGLDRRIALSLLCVPGVARSPARVVAALGLLTAVLSMWMSNSAITAVMLPIALGVVRSSPQFSASAEAKSGLVLMIAFAASVGGLATPVGTPTNLVALGAIETSLGQRMGFLEWMKFGVPLSLVLFAVLFGILRPRDANGVLGPEVVAEFRKQRDALGPMSWGERHAACAFFLALGLWMYPGLVELIAGKGAFGSDWLQSHLPEETVGLLAGLLLFVLPTNLRKQTFTIDWKDGAQIDWGTVLLFGGGLALGKAIFDTRLANTIGDNVIHTFGQPSAGTLTAVAIVLCILLSEATSNTASANVMVPTMITIAQASHLNPVPVAVASCLACSFGFMLPISTPPNALAYGTGLVRLPAMIRSGICLDIAGAIAIWLMVNFFM